MKLLKRIISITSVFMICTANTVFAKEIKAPDVRALGAVLMDEKSGRVLWEKNSKEPLPNASTRFVISSYASVVK